jgi:hypothetical protein
MTKRLSLWNQALRTPPDGTGESKDSALTIRAKFFKDNPHLIKTPDPDPVPPDPEPVQEDGPLEAGSWENQEVMEALPRESLPDRRGGKKSRRIPKHKTRRHAVSIAVSEEEERMLRTYAAGLNKSFSEWSRNLLFRAMGRKVPSRQGKPE